MGMLVIYYLPLDPFPALHPAGLNVEGAELHFPDSPNHWLPIKCGQWEMRQIRGWVGEKTGCSPPTPPLILTILQSLAETLEDGFFLQCPSSQQAAVALGLQ